MESHLHFIVQAYRVITPDGAMNDVTTIDLIAASHEVALSKAAVVIPAALKGNTGGYRISQVIEHFGERCERG